MATERINIVLSANDTATPQLKQFNAELGKTQKTSKDMQSSTSGLGSLKELGGQIQALGVAFAGNQFIQAVGDLNRLGIEARGTTMIFENMAVGFGGADALLSRLQKTTGNVVDDMTLMGGASSIMRMGLADTADGVNDLIEMAVKLKKPTETATEAIDNFTLMLSNQSVARLDSFGISSAKVRTRIDELLASGQALNREEAFTMAVMEQGNVAIEKLGDAANISETAMNKLGTQLQNLKADLAEVTAGALEAGAQLLLLPGMLYELKMQNESGTGADPNNNIYGKSSVYANIMAAQSGTGGFSTTSTDTFSVNMAATEAAMAQLEAQKAFETQMLNFQTEGQNTIGFGRARQNMFGGFGNSADEMIFSSGFDHLEEQFKELSENPLITDDQVASMKAIVDEAKGLADEAERAQQAFDNMNLSGMFGQTDGGRLGELGDMILGGMEDGDQKEAFKNALNMESGRETEISQAFETKFAPLLADVYDQFGEDVALAATEAALSALESGQMNGLTPEQIIANVGQAIGYDYSGTPGQSIQVMPGDNQYTLAGRYGGNYQDYAYLQDQNGYLQPGSYGGQGGSLISTSVPPPMDEINMYGQTDTIQSTAESMDAATTSATSLQTVVADIQTTSDSITLDTLLDSTLQNMDATMEYQSLLDSVAKDRTATIKVKVEFEYGDSAGKKLLQSDMAEVVNNNGGSIPE